MIQNSFVSAVVYLMNSQELVEDFLDLVSQVMAANFRSFEIICVDDGSTDRTSQRVRDYALNATNGTVSLITMGFTQGIEPSMNAGVHHSIGDFVFEFDTPVVDYCPELIMDTFKQCLKGFDIVSVGPDRSSRFTSKLFYSLFNRHANLEHRIYPESFRVISRRAINRVHSLSKTVPYRKALYANCGLEVYHINYKSASSSSSIKHHGQSRYRAHMATDSLILFTDVAYKFSFMMTTIMMLSTVGVGLYALGVFLLGQPVAGFTSLMLVMSGGFFATFLVLSIIVKYMSILIELNFKHNHYLIRSIEKLT